MSIPSTPLSLRTTMHVDPVDAVESGNDPHVDPALDVESGDDANSSRDVRGASSESQRRGDGPYVARMSFMNRLLRFCGLACNTADT